METNVKSFFHALHISSENNRKNTNTFHNTFLMSEKSEQICRANLN